jgi:hypothetical protein
MAGALGPWVETFGDSGLQPARIVKATGKRIVLANNVPHWRNRFFIGMVKGSGRKPLRNRLFNGNAYVDPEGAHIRLIVPATCLNRETSNISTRRQTFIVLRVILDD